MKKNILLILCVVAIIGCATAPITAYHAPGVDLKNLGSIYVVHFQPDKRHLERSVANELAAIGYRVTFGEEQDIPSGVDTLVTYIDRWQWDMSNYMFSFEIKFTNNQNKSLIASGKSYNWQRKEPDVIIAETLDKILK